MTNELTQNQILEILQFAVSKNFKAHLDNTGFKINGDYFFITTKGCCMRKERAINYQSHHEPINYSINSVEKMIIELQNCKDVLSFIQSKELIE